MSRSVRRVLAVDLGATHGRLAVFESDGGRLDRRSVEVHRLDDWASFDALIDSWWSKSRKLPALEAASVAVAGPIAVDSTAGQRARLTNRSWTVDVETLRDRLAVERVGLLNDIEALALGVLDLGADGLDTVHAGVERSGHLALLVPGTGLGQACLVWDGDRYWPMASEGGHVGFAPFDAESAALHARLSAAREHVSWEDVAAGSGLARVHDALLAGTDRRPHPDLTIAVDRSAAVARLAGDGGCALCARAADLWLRCLARRAGDLALTYLARGGIVLGGVAAHWLPQLRQLAFREAVRGHSPMRELLAEIPIRVVVADDAALRGAARHALHRLDAAP